MEFLNNPDAVLDAIVESYSENGSAAEESVKSVVRSILQDSDWHAADDEIEVSLLTGGITNILYLVSHKLSDRKVIVRVYGRGTEAFIDRSAENIVFAEMSRLGIGPTFFGRFTNGRVEGYINAKALTCDQLVEDEIYPHIASALARFHSTCIPQLATAAGDNFFLWSQIDIFFSLAEGDIFNVITFIHHSDCIHCDQPLHLYSSDILVTDEYIRYDEVKYHERRAQLGEDKG